MDFLAQLAGAVLVFAGVPHPDAVSDVKICVEQDGVPPNVLVPAEDRASKILAPAGAHLRWLGRRECEHRAIDTIAIHLFVHSLDPHGGSLACTRLAYGTIDVYYDRLVEDFAPERREIVLAHVLVHELTHAIQNVNRHSDSGMMKAHWDRSDYWEMVWRPLPFEVIDLLLIHNGLEARAQQTTASARRSRP